MTKMIRCVNETEERRNNMNNTNGMKVCISFLLGLLTIAFIVLKLIGIINWSWIWVFGPVWIPIALIAAIVLTLLIIAGVMAAVVKILGGWRITIWMAR